MATIRLEIPEEDRKRFVEQAEREGKTLESWLISVASRHVSKSPKAGTAPRFKSAGELREFWQWCDSLQDRETEPDWEEHLRIMDLSRRKGLPII